jgi:NAD(P)-dependent dehydrogenase (short-subunit alcohol dehydrogenase family)
MNLEGKSVVVTGAGSGMAGSGMGEATAVAYAERGAKVLAADIDADAARRVVDAIREAGGTAVVHQVDLRHRDEVNGMIDAALDHFGTIDILANVAGIYPHVPIEDMTEEFFDNVLAVDLKGPLFACQAAVRHMKKGAGGAIVNVAAKAALVALGRSVALEGGPSIRVNSVLPGPTRHVGIESRRRSGEVGRPGPTSTPLGSNEIKLPLLDRSLYAEEIADVIVWASSDAARAVNGALFRVDGGYFIL